MLLFINSLSFIQFQIFYKKFQIVKFIKFYDISKLLIIKKVFST